MTVYTFPDAQLAALELLRADARFAGVEFGTKPQDADAPRPLPYVAIRLDRSVPRLRVLQTATIRVSVWHTSEALGLALAQSLHAVLLAYAGGDAIRNVGELAGPVPTEDPDTGAPLSFFTVAARLRPTPL